MTLVVGTVPCCRIHWPVRACSSMSQSCTWNRPAASTSSTSTIVGARGAGGPMPRSSHPAGSVRGQHHDPDLVAAVAVHAVAALDPEGPGAGLVDDQAIDAR